MKKLLLFLLITIIISSSQKIYASHSFASDLNWSYVGQDTFLVTLNYYLDCNGHISNFNRAITVKCATTGSSITTLNLDLISTIDVTPICNASCSRCQSSSCSFPYGVVKYTYAKLLILSNIGSCCKISMSFYESNRNGTITTGAANQGFYTEALLDRCISHQNNSVSFSSDPFAIICIGQDFVFSPGTVNSDLDSNGNPLDSIRYDWTPPLAGANSPISYTGQYAYNKPIYFWGFPNVNLPFPRGYHLDHVTGNISFKPMKIEQTVFAVKVEEWRKVNGTMTLIGHVRKDMQLIVISCPNNNAPVLSGPYYKEICAGDTAVFSIATIDYDSKDTLNISWDNSIPNAIWITNNGYVKHPYAILKIPTDTNDISPIPQVFTVTVKDDACPVNGSSTRAYQLLIKKADTSSNSLSFNKQYLGCGNYLFTVNNPTVFSNYSWYFYDTVLKSTSGTTANFKYYNARTYPVVLQASSGNCYKTATSNVVVSNSFPLLQMKKTAYITPVDTITLTPKINLLPALYSFSWQDGDTINFNRTFYYDSTKTIDKVILTVSDTGACIVKDSCTIYYGYVHMSAGSDIVQCDSNALYLLDGQINYVVPGLKVVDAYWYFDGDTIPIANSDTISIKKTGNYIFEVILSNGYVAHDTLNVSLNQKSAIYLDPDTTVCSNGGLIPLQASPNSSSSYWYGSHLKLIGGKYFFDPTSAISGKFTLEYNYVNQFGCIQSAYRKITVKKKYQKPEIGSLPPICLNANRRFFDTSTYPGIFIGKGIVNDHWFDPKISGLGTHEIVYKLGADLCPEYDTTYITVFSLPAPELVTKSGLTEFCHNYGNIELLGTPAGGVYKGFNINGNTVNTLDQPGSFIVRYQYTDSNACSNTDTLFISLIDTPGFDFTANKLSINLKDSLPIVFHMQALADPYSFEYYSWDFGDGTTSNATNPSHYYVNPGSYTVSLIIHNENRCSGMLTKENLISVVVGVEEKIQNRIEIKPNPANDKTLISTQIDLKKITVYNSLGKVILQKDLKQKEYVLEMPAKGLFYIQLQDIENNIYFKKVIFN